MNESCFFIWPITVIKNVTGLIYWPGLPRSGKSQGKTKIFQGQGKVREFCKKSGKISVLVKVSEKSGKSQGIFWVLMSGNPVEHEEKNIDGLQKKLKLM